MKKLLLMFLTLAIAVAACLAFASCGAPEGDDGDSAGCNSHVDENNDGKCDSCGAETGPYTPSVDHLNADGELILFKNGAPTFRFVKGSDIGSLSDSVDDLAELLSSLSTSQIEVVANTSEPTDVEILIGTVTTRGDNYKISKYSLGEKGYMVKQIGTKIVVLGGNDTSLATAFKHLKENVFGIKKNNDAFTDFAMAKDKNLEAPQNDYKVKSVKIDGKSISEYTIYYNSNAAKSVATDFRKDLYSKVGVYLDLTGKSVVAGTPTIQFNVLENSGAGNGYEVKVEDGNLIINCEFGYLFEDLATEFYKTNITESKKANVTLAAGVVETKDIRNIYYEDFGAFGDGKTNDFEAIYNAHERANQYGHIVNGTKDQTYYIGSTGGKYATIMTDTNWNGCNFIFDDSIIAVHNATTCPYGATAKCVDCADRGTAVFEIKSGLASVDLAKTTFAQFNKDNPLKGGWGEEDNTTVIPNWSLDYSAWVYIATTERKVFIRHGPNADDGDHQSEFILVHPGGIIDPTTPLSWDYESISWAIAYNVDPDYVKPITLDGGGALVETWVNRPGEDVQNEYNQFMRNILITRSNTTVKNIDHRNVEDYIYRAPYAGFINPQRCSNVTFQNITLDRHNGKFQNNVEQGTYEIGGYAANDLKYINVKMIDFFCDGNKYDFKRGNGTLFEPGEVSSRGSMGTNYCRNFYFDDCILHGFDSHKGLGNLVIKNSVLKHVSCIGSGTVELINSTVYVDPHSEIFILRPDYGSTWRGDIIIKDVAMKFSKDYKENNLANELKIINCSEYIHDADYDAVYNPETGKYEKDNVFINYMPQNITIDNLTLERYSYTGYDKATDSLIGEKEESAAGHKVYIFNPNIHSYTNVDISKDFSHKYLPPKTITITNCAEGFIVMPNTPQFKSTVYTFNGNVIPLY